MTNIFNILDYGAIGDGKTDCTAAIQKALDDASYCQGKVEVPPGIYCVSRLYMHGQGVSLVGNSAWSFRSDGSSIFILNDSSVDCMIDITGAFGCSIRGMSLDGNNLGNIVHGIKLYWDKYNGGSEEDTPTIDDCRIGKFTGDGVHLEHIWCFSVRHSMLHDNGRAGLFIDGWDGFILDNWLSCNSGGGISGGGVVASITCTGNRVEWNRRGGFIIPFGDSYNITGNFFDRSFGPAIELGSEDTDGVSLATITGNIFRRSGAYETALESSEHCSHVILTNCSNMVVMGNTMRVGRNDGGGGVLSPDYGFIIKNCKDCLIKDNTMMTGAKKELIIASSNTNCIIDNNIGSLADENTKTASSLLN